MFLKEYKKFVLGMGDHSIVRGFGGEAVLGFDRRESTEAIP